MNFLAATVTTCDATQVTLDLGGRRPVVAAVADTTRLRPGAKVTLGLRPEHLTDATPEAGQLDGEVFALEHLGSETYVHLACGQGDPLVLRAAGDTAIEVGQRGSVAVQPQACYLFDDTGTALRRPIERTPSVSTCRQSPGDKARLEDKALLRATPRSYP